ncbi:MAG: tetratricopeptide repeat protein [Deltaproteobacteria bacterium]|nr:tetratricopeptide repeat protein [Deltaproteobacteria bacterium]
MRKLWKTSVVASASAFVLAWPAGLVAQQQPAAAQPAARPSAPAMNAACVPTTASAPLGECPAGARGQTPRMGTKAPETRVVAVSRRVLQKGKGPAKGPSQQLDFRTLTQRRQLERRSEQLLRQEIQLTQRLLRNTRRDNAQRPEILLRLAENWVELQQAARLRSGELDEQIFQARRRRNRRRVEELTREQRAANQTVNETRQEAIRSYAQLVQEHPDFPRMDQVLFYLGFALEEMRQHDRSRQVYHRLIKAFPTSKFIPNAYLSFAEYYFAQGDMEAAMQFYQKVVEFPPERNNVYGFALYKQAWCAYNLQDFRGSLQKFVEVIEFARANPDRPDARQMARSARSEMIMPYAQVGTPARALEFFRRYAENEQGAFELLERLAELYFDTGEWPKTIDTYHRLMQEQPSSSRVCLWQGRVTQATISSRPKPDQVREAQRLSDIYDQFRQGRHPEAQIRECKQTTAGVLVDLATHWHREAVGTEEQPGTRDRRTMEMAASLYERILNTFPDLEQLEFPDIDRRDWPTRYRISYFFAELLWKMEDWRRCGPAFDRVVELNSAGEFTADAAYAAVLCYNNLYQQEFGQTERQRRDLDGSGGRTRGRGRGRGQAQQPAATPPANQYAVREFTPLEQGMLAAFQRFVCYVQDSEDLPQIKYRRARIYFEANRVEEAALLFREVAYEHPETELAPFAANLYLDSIIILGQHREPPRDACFDQGEADIPRFEETFCRTPEMQEANEHLCDRLANLGVQLMRKRIEALARQRRFREAARQSIMLVRRYRSAEDLDEVLYNAAIYYQAARLLGRAIRVREVLIERHAESEYARRAMYQIGANFHALAIYGRAADFYTRYAERYGSQAELECTDTDRREGLCPNAVEALQNAVFFRLGLGEEEQAVQASNLFERLFGRRNARETSRVIYSIGAIYERQEQWSRVVDHYNSYLRRFGRTAPPDEVLRANVAIGNAYWKQNDAGRAEPYFRTAVQVWERGLADAIARDASSSEDERAVRLARARDALANAVFHQGEILRNAFNAIRVPEYRGGRSPEEFQRWSQGELLQWVTRKQGALNAAKQVYERIRQIQTPQWEIAAAARVGEMWRTWVDTFRATPAPPNFQGNEEMMAVWEEELDRVSEPWIRQATEAFQFCLITATRLRWFNEYSRTCEAELNRLNPAEYPLAAELRAQPTWSRADVNDSRPVLELGVEESEADVAAERPAGAAGGEGGGAQ